MKNILFLLPLILLSCTIEDNQDCIKITKIESRESGYYLTLENNTIIYINTLDYKIGDYYCFK
jgi:hypothetical protein